MSNQYGILAEPAFLAVLSLERKRTERSGRRFILMLLECSRLAKAGEREAIIGKILQALGHTIRDTDVRGWYENQAVLGVIFTEIGTSEGASVIPALLGKVSSVLAGALSLEQVTQINLSFQVFPTGIDGGDSSRPADLALYPDLIQRAAGKKIARVLKRSIDIGASALALLLLSPLFALIAISIKLTSKGPVLFRQTRLGLNGKAFPFLKFRSMQVSNDQRVHEEFVKRLIAGSLEPGCGTGAQLCVYKMTKDSRVTPLGGLLRKTSLDELPQFVNVLKGEMSLVGPRPPIPYEVSSYQAWHQRRLLAVKPGITGLWQVQGRSRVKFDDMVRLDLRYAASWSLWGDLQILLKTPRAVVTGAH